MSTKLCVKGKDYSLITKTGLADDRGFFLIPKEYDRIVRVNDSLFAAIDDGYNYKKDVVQGNLTEDEINIMWGRDSIKEDFLVQSIDFYSSKGKLKTSEKILAFYWSQSNNVLLLLDINYRWNIGYADYERNEIIIFNGYKGLVGIKEVCGGRFIIKRDVLIELIPWNSDNGGRISFIDIHPISFFEKGFVVKKKGQKYGFMDYYGKLILDYRFTSISLKEDYIEVATGDKMYISDRGIYSYSGKCIVPSMCISVEVVYGNDSNIFFIAKKRGERNIYYDIYTIDGSVINPSPWYNVKVFSNGTIIYSQYRNKVVFYGAKKSENGSLRDILPHKYVYMNYVYKNENTYIIARKCFYRYALFDLEGNMLKKFRYKCFIPKKERWMFE